MALVVRPDDRRHLHRRRRPVDREEVDFLPASKVGLPAENYGWNRYEGDARRRTCSNPDAGNNSAPAHLPQVRLRPRRRVDGDRRLRLPRFGHACAAGPLLLRRHRRRDVWIKTADAKTAEEPPDARLHGAGPLLVRRELDRRALRGRSGSGTGLQARRRTSLPHHAGSNSSTAGGNSGIPKPGASSIWPGTSRARPSWTSRPSSRRPRAGPTEAGIRCRTRRPSRARPERPESETTRSSSPTTRG